MSVEHINITIPTTLKNRLDAFLVKLKMKRSTFIQKAIVGYIKEKETQKIAKDLEKGYKLMALESEKDSEEWFDLEEEAI